MVILNKYRPLFLSWGWRSVSFYKVEGPRRAVGAFHYICTYCLGISIQMMQLPWKRRSFIGNLHPRTDADVALSPSQTRALLAIVIVGGPFILIYCLGVSLTVFRNMGGFRKNGRCWNCENFSGVGWKGIKNDFYSTWVRTGFLTLVNLMAIHFCLAS